MKRTITGPKRLKIGTKQIHAKKKENGKAFFLMCRKMSSINGRKKKIQVKKKIK